MEAMASVNLATVNLATVKRDAPAEHRAYLPGDVAELKPAGRRGRALLAEQFSYAGTVSASAAWSAT